MACPSCSCLIIDYSKSHDHEIPLPFDLQDVYPELSTLTENANGGCEFCDLLAQLIGEYFDVTESCLPRPVHFHLKNARFQLESCATVKEDGEDDAVFMLAVDLVYGEASKTQTIFFTVNSDAQDEPHLGQDGMHPRLHRPLEEDPLSERSVAQMRGWISDCIESHQDCAIANNGFIPSRLLNVQDGINLQDTREMAPVPYVALSHCWGTHIAEKPMLKTTWKTIEEKMVEIPWNSLPANFQDAINVTRALGYDYIWIDSLCIIQDCTRDWEQEAGKMAEVYKYATVTIVPTAAKSCHDGFIRRRNLRGCRIPYRRPSSGDGDIDGNLILQLSDGAARHWHREVNESWWRYRGWTLQEWMLSRRVLHFTAGRIYHECKDAYLTRIEGDEPPGWFPPISDFNPEAWDKPGWSSEGCSDSESDEEGSVEYELADSNMGPSFSENDKPGCADDEMDVSDLLDDSSEETRSASPEINEKCSSDSVEIQPRYFIFMRWYLAMQDYSSRSLTYEQDKLPATEGLARELSSKRYNLGRYLAGIWEADLALGLLWRPFHQWPIDVEPAPFVWPPPRDNEPRSAFTKVRVPVSAPEEYRAPSWSWASLDGKIHWANYPQNGVPTGTDPSAIADLTNGTLELVEVDLQFKGESVYGRVENGSLMLRATYQKVQVSGPHSQEQVKLRGDRGFLYDDFAYCVHTNSDEFAWAAFDMISPPPGNLYALKLINQTPGLTDRGVLSGLLLQESDRKQGAYRRVGVFIIREGHLDAFDNISPEFITLV
uniref:Vegetative incompatibility protein 1a n=2 Tax=Cryphonectria parasitica TaxID=5116 RepID=W1I9Y2_CRYPA|nr:vegetative incompatibility protein 1a [Cryphonectria parasitica]